VIGEIADRLTEQIKSGLAAQALARQIYLGEKRCVLEELAIFARKVFYGLDS